MMIRRMCAVFCLFVWVVACVLPGDDAVAQQPSGQNAIREIVVETNMEDFPGIDGTKTLIINQSGLKVGSQLSQDNVANAILTLWHLDIFNDIRVDSEPMEGGRRVIIVVDMMALTNSFTITGNKEFRTEEIVAAAGLVQNKAIGERKVTAMRQTILNLYKEKGFLAAKVDITLTPLADTPYRVDVAVNITEGKKVKIKSIQIVGNEAFDDKKIKKALKNTKEDRWYRSGEFNEQNYEDDKRMLVSLYKSEGFRDAAVLRDSTYIDEETGKISLTIFVQEGQQYVFGTTTFEGNSRFADEELRTGIRYQEGDIFNEQELLLSVYGYPEQDIQGIQTLYNDAGYLKTYIDPVETVRGDSIDVFIDIAEGNISNVSQVNITGNTKTIEKVIRREISLDPGQPFSRSRLDRSRRDILALNFFQDVQYDYELEPDSDDVRIEYIVEEKQTGMASMGAGYSERDKLVGTLSFTNQNLFGRGQSINFNWDMGSRRKAFQLGFGEPWLFDTPTSLSFDVFNIISSDYTTAFDEERRRGVSISLGRRLDRWIDYSTAYISYRLEDVDYANAAEYYTYYLITGRTSSLSLTFLRDSRDMPQFASSGGRTSVTAEIAGGPLGGDLSYYKYTLNNEIYSPVFWKLTLMLRTRLGYMKGYEESRFVPYSERFMPGGTSYDGIVRGYPNRQVCPLLSGEEIGGETMMVNNIELQVPIVAQTLYGVMFYDFGNAWRNFSETNPFDVKRSVGIGARVFVPGIGNIGFDVGYGFDRLEGYSKASGWRTHFQFGNMW